MNRIGSLCTGYGGLDLAVERVLGGQMVWYSEFDKHPSTLLAQRFPGIPNLGDLSKIDWNAVPSIDILTGGYPCQPFSQAGKRLGEDDPRHLWPYIREAIRVLRPRVTILENVAGHRSKGFAEVLRDCAEDGLYVRWVSVRASDAGAPHRRERIFFTVSDADGSRLPIAGRQEEEPGSSSDGCTASIADSKRIGCGGLQITGHGRPEEATDRTAECSEATSDASSRRLDRWWAAPRQASRPHVAATGRCVSVPTHNTRVNWLAYEAAVRRWEGVLGRPAPDPSEPNKNGKPRLTAAFDEWMMGLPAGWVTDINIPYGAKIKLLGNGVVPQQADLAIRHLT